MKSYGRKERSYLRILLCCVFIGPLSTKICCLWCGCHCCDPDGAVRVCGYSTEMHEYEREGFVSDAGIDTLAFLGNRRLIGSSNQILHVWDVDTPEAQLPTSERAR